MAMKSESFKAFARHDSRVLILGTLPGQVSLQRAQYYAHPRNGFWPIMSALLGLPPGLPYEKRIDRLARRGITPKISYASTMHASLKGTDLHEKVCI